MAQLDRVAGRAPARSPGAYCSEANPQGKVTGLPQPISQPAEPLVSAVLAMLKAAKELDCEINRTKLAKLLYFADLRAIEVGGTAFSGAVWRWRNYGPYDNALIRAERIIVSADLADVSDQRSDDGGTANCVDGRRPRALCPQIKWLLFARLSRDHGSKSRCLETHVLPDGSNS